MLSELELPFAMTKPLLLASLRREPVFIVISQSAATAACLAIDDQVPVQQVNQEKLRACSLQGGQKLAWPAK
jgi:hypothetical protein